MKITATVTKTRDGLNDYIQVITEDQTTVNVVLVAEEIQLRDHRENGSRHDSKGRSAHRG